MAGGEKLHLIGSISTHYHQDRTAGIAWLKQHHFATYASKQTNQLLIDHQQIPAEFDLTHDSAAKLKQILEVYYPGGGHTIDNLVI